MNNNQIAEKISKLHKINDNIVVTLYSYNGIGKIKFVIVQPGMNNPNKTPKIILRKEKKESAGINRPIGTNILIKISRVQNSTTKYLFLKRYSWTDLGNSLVIFGEPNLMILAFSSS